jgi:hypothetical protein
VREATVNNDSGLLLWTSSPRPTNKFGDTEIQNGRWQLLGQVKGWNPNEALQSKPNLIASCRTHQAIQLREVDR